MPTERELHWPSLIVPRHLEQVGPRVGPADLAQLIFDISDFIVFTAAIHHELEFPRHPPLSATSARQARGQPCREPRARRLESCDCLPLRFLPSAARSDARVAELHEIRVPFPRQR